MSKIKIKKTNLILYNLYFLIKQDYKSLLKDIQFIKYESNRNEMLIIFDMFKCAISSGVSYSDYCYLKFYSKGLDERAKYIGTAEIYEFQKKLNKKGFVKYFNNKTFFNEKFNDYVKRDYFDVNKNSLKDLESWVKNKEVIIAKPSEGTIGGGIKKINVKEFEQPLDLYQYLKVKNLDLIEDLIMQNKELNMINPDSVNTIRIMTVLDREMKVNILGAAIRMSTGKVVDNFNAGGIAAPIDIKTGEINGPAVSKNIQDKRLYYKHPTTNIDLIGFKIPYWNKVIKMIEDACSVVPEVKTVGWDIAITDTDVLLVEGNHNWCKNFFQQVYDNGKRELILKYYDN